MGISFPHSPRDGSSITDEIRALGVPYFYVFEQQEPEADQQWAGASRSIPSSLYWASGTPEAALGRPTRDTLRPAQPHLLGVLEIPGVGHWPQHEAAEVLNRALLGFLSRTGR